MSVEQDLQNINQPPAGPWQKFKLERWIEMNPLVG